MQRFHLVFPLVLATCSLAVDVGAQTLTQNIRGTVTDAHSNEPLIGATIVIVGFDPVKGTVSGSDGRFRLEDVPVGRHTLAASYVGYESTTLPDVLVGSGKEVILDITLSESLLEYDEVVVTANEEEGMPRNEMVSVSAMSISVEELSRYAATFDDPGRTAISFPGVRGAGDDVLNEIVVRGNSPRGILWRIDGVDVPNPNHFAQVGTAGGGISMLSNSMLQTSDFYTAAFPGEYGNALSGVFDIHLRNGNNEKREYAFELGVIGIQAAAEGPISRKTNSSYLVNYRYSALGLLQDLGLDIQGIIRFQDLSFKMAFPTESAGRFNVWGLGGLSSQTIEAEPENFDPYNEQFDQQYAVGGITHTLPIGNGTFIHSSLTGSHRGHEFVEDSLAIVQEDYENFTTTTGRLASAVTRKFNARHTASVGASLTLQDYDFRSSFFQNAMQREIPLLADSGTTTMAQAFAEWQFRVNEAFTLNSGLHFLRLQLNGSSAFEPRLGFRWSVAQGHVLTGGVGIHSRAETPAIYLAQRETPTGEFVQPNLDLGLTRARHYVVGYENYLIPSLRFKTEFYFQDLFDVPVLDPDFGDADWMRAFSLLNATDGYTNLPLVSRGVGRNYGVELTIEKFFTGSYYLMATGSVYQSKYDVRDGPEANTRFSGNFIANVLGGKEFRVGSKGNNILSLNARVIFSGNNRQPPVDLEASQAAGFTILDWSRPYALRLKNYFRLDIGVRYIMNTASLSHIISVSAQNLTNRLNEMEQFYAAGAVRSEEQFGLIPNFSYRVEF